MPGDRGEQRARRRLVTIVAIVTALGTAAGLAVADDTVARRSRRAPATTRVEADAPAPSAAAQDPDWRDPTLLETPIPTRWEPSRGRRPCHRRGRRRWCDGPLRVPVATGAEAALARELGLGELATAHTLLLGRPEDRWVAAVAGRASETLYTPVAEGRVWRGFGRTRRNSRKLHKGIDFGAPVGTRVRSVNDGIVAYADNEVRGYGNLVIVIHADASASWYAHLEAAYVFAGQQVLRGQVIGEVGETGLAHGAHLHFEWHANGRPRNPARLLVHPDPAVASQTGELSTGDDAVATELAAVAPADGEPEQERVTRRRRGGREARNVARRNGRRARR